MLAIFSAVGALVSIAGFFLSSADVAGQLDSLTSVLPADAASIIQDQINQVTGGSDTATGLAALIGFVLALYGATKGMMSLMEGMNVAYDEDEARGIIALYGTGLALTIFLIFGLIVAFGVIIVGPAVVSYLGLPDAVQTIILWLQWPLLAALTMIGLAVVYRFGPSREEPKWRWVSPGAIISTVLWLVGTVAFSVYAQNFGSYNETYGTLGGVIVLLTWLWLSAFIILEGAELTAEIEHQTRKDTTTGPAIPEEQRGAVKADTRPDGFEGTASLAMDRPVEQRKGLTAPVLGMFAAAALMAWTDRKSGRR